MRAVVLHPDPFRSPLSVQDWPRPVVPPGWVLVRLKRAALNRLDEMTVRDRSDFNSPVVIGSDGAGVIVELGPGTNGHPDPQRPGATRRVHVGDEVLVSPSLWWGDDESAPGPDYEILGAPTQGTHAQYVAVPVENVYPKPVNLTWDEAAALPLAGMTAWRALVTRGRLRTGETVVIAAASSGVGAYAIQVAAALGARVIAVTGSADKALAVKTLGADEVVLRTGDDFAERLHAATGGRADLSLDPTGALWQPLLAATRPGGRLVAVGQMASPQATVRVQTVYWRQVDILGSSMGSPADFAALLDHVAAHSWRPVIDSVLPLSAIEAAYERLDAPERIGKVLLDVHQ
jgi:NADPH:quinone reductase-like Zn-dependent oxidoreductase